MQKRILLINDLSGVGKCSLTVAVPIISAFGYEASVIPTAVLSTHTGGFDGFTFCDLTDNMLKMAEHWHRLKLHFDAIYCGYLGSDRQVNIVIEIIKLLKSDDTLVIIDPVMADFGKLYTNFKPDFPQKLLPLCNLADIIVPNITEACLLTGTEYQTQHTPEFAQTLLDSLKTKLKSKNFVLTGVYKTTRELGAACLLENGEVSFSFDRQIKGVYHGSGDVFCSTMCGYLMKTGDLKQSVQHAVEFTAACIKRTRESGIDTRYGLEFEPELKNLQ